MTEAQVPRCNCCRTRDVAILLECHNSACRHYANPQRIYEGWRSAQEAPAAVAGPSEAVKFTDQSTADPVEKARRYLSAMGSNHLHSSYFFDDGYPKQESATDALATLAVLEQLAAAPTTQPAPSVELGVLQAEIAGHEAANLHLSAMVDELRELLQDAKRAMTELHQAAIPDESAEGVPAIIPPDAFRAFVDAHAKLCFCLHQSGHNPVQDAQQPAHQQEPASVDLKTMELAESVGLIGPASRTHDLHAAIQRFHDLICANATIKAAQMAAEAIGGAAPQQEAQREEFRQGAAWAAAQLDRWMASPTFTNLFDGIQNRDATRVIADWPKFIVELSEIAAPQPSPASQGDALDAARYRYLRDGDWREHEKLESVIRLQLNTLWDETIDAARAAQEGKA